MSTFKTMCCLALLFMLFLPGCAGIAEWGIWSLIAFGGYMFWGIIALLCIPIGYCCRRHEESVFWPLLWIFVGLIVLWIFGDFNPFSRTYNYINENRLFTLELCVGYVFIGLLWSMFKWYKYSKKALQESYNAYKRSWLHEKGKAGDDVPAELLEEWRRYIEEKISHHRPYIPGHEHQTERIVSWMMFWPLSMVVYVLEDLIRDFFEFIYRQFARVFQLITDIVFRKVRKELGEELYTRMTR